MTLRFPSTTPGGLVVEVPHPSRVVVIGANGSGKTRLGIWLEGQNQGHIPVHRIGAQKALALPDYAEVKNVEQAERELYFGRSDQHASTDRKIHDRWGGNPATHLLNDYNGVLALLFAKESERDRIHTQMTREVAAYLPVPDSAIDNIVKLWSYLMPHRSVSFHDGKVVVNRGTPAEYHAKEMSDGERVTLYLLGQCLTAPPGSLVIVDEPELHLHKSLMDKLWNKVEELCPDKSIVYITHDLDFAASRYGASKFWVQSFTAGAWTWSELPTDEALPESLVLELVGNRKPVLFCEGERGGLDHSLYQLCYPSYHVVPRGSSEKVVESVKALNANPALHTLTAFGLVDRDHRSDDEIAALERHQVFSIPFAEIENLLCNEQVLSCVGQVLARDPAETVRAVTEYVSRSLTAEIELQVTQSAARRIRYHLSCFSPLSNDRAGLQAGVDALLATLDITAIAADAEARFRAALQNQRLDDILKIYNRKSLADQVSTCLGLKHAEYRELVFRLAKDSQSSDILGRFLNYLPRR
ncbi:AAA family ATPase [Synechococcus sp. BO 8801]|uniref:DUF4435 domain-containing protein n=1 Tax=Synechococcus sp. BO 8801 TaxID=169670 RepID=UPI0018E9836F|nr:AAA family ATPase [Synechococcus sp. BO 8801]